jgi:hypothetical protein
MRSIAKLAAPLGLIPFALLFSSRAFAGDAAAAQALFDDASRLMAQNRLAEACAKFDESQRQDPGIGTLYHFADCEDRLGKTATAWAAFREVASEARALGQTARVIAAQGRVATIEPRLARLKIDPGADRGTPGLQVLRDGQPIGPSEWGMAIPVDPGAHIVEARAPGKGGWAGTANATDGSSTLITVPLLASIGVSAAEVPAGSVSSMTQTTSGELPVSRRGGGQRAAGIVVGAAGLVGLGIGGYFGARSIMDHHDSDAHCTGNACDATGVAQRNDAQQTGMASTIALSAGGAALLVGIITYATAPSGHRDPLPSGQTGSRPTVAIGPGSVMLQGTW